MNLARHPFVIYIKSMCREQKKLTRFILAAYFCHGSWEEKGTWYTIASQRNSEFPVGLGQTFCFSMRLENARGRASGRSGRQKQQELELWLSKPSRTCRIETKEEWTYRSSNQGNQTSDIITKNGQKSFIKI